MSNKTHFSKVFKSDHLGVLDLEEMLENGRNLVFTISHVKQEIGAKVAGKRIDANIAYFKENIKPLVLNATNSKRIKHFAKSSFVEDWNDILIELYIDAGVKMKGEVVGGVRIRTKQPRLEPKPLPTITDDRFSKLLDAIEAGNYTKDKAIKSFSLTADQKQKLK